MAEGVCVGPLEGRLKCSDLRQAHGSGTSASQQRPPRGPVNALRCSWRGKLGEPHYLPASLKCGAGAQSISFHADTPADISLRRHGEPLSPAVPVSRLMEWGERRLARSAACSSTSAPQCVLGASACARVACCVVLLAACRCGSCIAQPLRLPYLLTCSPEASHGAVSSGGRRSWHRSLRGP